MTANNRLIPPRVGVVDDGNSGTKNPPRVRLNSAISGVSVAHVRRNQARSLPAADWLSENREAIRHLPLIEAPEPRHECMVVGCTRSVQIRGLCKQHHRRARRMFDPTYPSKTTTREDNN
jgi:hypothetical protein